MSSSLIAPLKNKLSFMENLIDFICEKLVRKKIKKQFGGNLRAFISGGGALDKEVGTFLNPIGLPTLQGYGLTIEQIDTKITNRLELMDSDFLSRLSKRTKSLQGNTRIDRLVNDILKRKYTYYGAQ